MEREGMTGAALDEHRFWLQILGDHARFIENSLAPKEAGEIERARRFAAAFDQLLAEARKDNGAGLKELTRQSYKWTLELREFKLHLLQRHLAGTVGTSLPPSFYNHMVNELEEYVRVLQALMKQEAVPVFPALHHHLLWLDDAVGHAGSIGSSLDLAEKRMRELSRNFETQFLEFYYKAVQLAGYLRTRLRDFPALRRFNKQVELEMLLFMEFLEELKSMGLTMEDLGTLTPLMADHMAREECYYLTKLSAVTDLKRPGCDPAHPRVEMPQ
jgi:hypothetical protein